MSGIIGDAGSESGIVGSTSTDVTSKFVLQSSWNVWNGHKCFKVNEFIFCSLTTYSERKFSQSYRAS